MSDTKEKISALYDGELDHNEIDDLFALVRAIGEPKFDLKGITASQFHTSPYASKNTALESHKMNQKLLRSHLQIDIQRLWVKYLAMLKTSLYLFPKR